MRLSFVFLCSYLLLCNCAYQFGHTSRTLPGNHKTVYVEIFKNNTPEVGAEADFTQALVRELQRSGFATVTHKNSAELILKGTIVNAEGVGSGPIRRFQNPTAENPNQSYEANLFRNYALNVLVNLAAVRAHDKKVIWQTDIRGNQVYRGAQLTQPGLRSSNVLYNQSRRTQTMKQLAEQMMQEAFDRLTETF